MPRKAITSSPELEAVLKALEGFPEGVNLAEIKKASGSTADKRTLQRRLGVLIKQKKVFTTGKTTTLRYHLAGEKKTEISSIQVTAHLPLSEQSRQILSFVNQPIEQRKEVGYNRAFLDNYEPNKSFYLDPKEREHLRITGTTTATNQAAGTYAKQVLGRLLIDLSWNSSRLEGNTYSLLDTSRLIDEGTPATESSAEDTQMILNHKDAIEFIVRNAEEGIGLNRYTILSLHALLSNNLLPDSSASGRLRRHGVGIGQSVYKPLDIGAQIEEQFDLVLQKASAVNDPFEQAFFLMVHLPYLQAFDDVNKRVSRLAVNISLNQHNLAPLSFTDVPKDMYISGLLGVYELNRVELLKDVFIWAYERSAVRYANLRQTLGEPDPFRLKYREPIKAVISSVIGDALNAEEASKRIKEAATAIPEQEKFIEAVETELLNLHEGNFARYWVTPSQFKTWQERWKGKN